MLIVSPARESTSRPTPTMCSRQFLDTLRSIGCPDVEKLTPESIDWLFENEKTKPFLNWIGNCISKDNLLTYEDLTRFALLEASGKVLNGEDLQRSFASVGSHKGCTEEQQLQSTVESLKTSVKQSKASKNKLVKRCNKISVQHMELKNKVSRMEEVEDLWKRQKQQAEDKCRSENAQVGEVLQQLSKSVSDLMELYQSRHRTQQTVTKDAGGGSYFLSQMELDAFHEAEARFSKELTAFTKKQFFVGMSDMAGEKEEAEYHLLDVSSTAKVSQVDDSQESETFYNCKEFARLQDIFPQSECARINALINAKKAASAVHEARSILHQLKSRVFPTRPEEITSLRHAAEQTAASSKASSSPLLSPLPDLVKELGGLQGTEVLTGDYDLKLRRQDYFVTCQDKVIEHLISQRARAEFLSMLYDLELQWHQETHGLLSAAKQVLENHLLEWQARMTEMDEPDLSEKKFERNVVDTRDTSTARLFQVMGELTGSSKEEDRQLYLPVQKVLQQATQLKAKHSAAQASDTTRQEQDLDKVKQLDLYVSEEEAVLYAGSSTCRGLPNLTPASVQSALTQVSTQLAGLESRVMDTVAQVNTRRQELKKNVLQKKERDLYVLFHTNPEKLKHVVSGLAEKVKTLDIQES